MGSRKKNRKKGAAGEGYRVFAIDTWEERVVLRKLYTSLTRIALALFEGRPLEEELERIREDLERRKGKLLKKEALYYAEEWYNALKVCRVQHEKAKIKKKKKKKRKRKPKRRIRWPPYLMALNFAVEVGGKLKHVYGRKGACCVVVLNKNVLRINVGTAFPEIKVRLREGIVRDLEEELKLKPAPTFTLQLTQRGRIRIVARRTSIPWWKFKEESSDATILRGFKRVVAIDINSENGIAVLALNIDQRGRVTRRYQRRFKFESEENKLNPINDLQSYSDAPSSEKLKSLLGSLPRRLAKCLAKLPLPSRAKSLVRLLHRARKKDRKVRANALLHEIRVLVREVEGKALIIIDAPRAESLRGSRLQKTYLRVKRLLRNLAAYENCPYIEKIISGLRCPLCKREGLPVRVEGRRPRYYKCSHCDLIFDRDWSTTAQLTALFVPSVLHWLNKHRTILAPNVEQ